MPSVFQRKKYVHGANGSLYNIHNYADDFLSHPSLRISMFPNANVWISFNECGNFKGILFARPVRLVCSEMSCKVSIPWGFKCESLRPKRVVPNALAEHGKLQGLTRLRHWNVISTLSKRADPKDPGQHHYSRGKNLLDVLLNRLCHVAFIALLSWGNKSERDKHWPKEF